VQANEAIINAIQERGLTYVHEVIAGLPPKARAIATIYVDILNEYRGGPQMVVAKAAHCSTSRVSQVALLLRRRLNNAR
jgi:hypothetical protein